ncbi:unnamed protein product [Leptosia nina]|uniref:Juvenile hormone binding protein n=1 Tax=Leptosia nina TaxID=320188 RepID=A0AAV1K0S5_9NEOP
MQPVASPDICGSEVQGFKMRPILYVLLLTIQLAITHCANPLSYKGRCSVRDSNCITRHVQLKAPAIAANVLSEAASRSLDPLIIDAAEIDIAGLKINFYKAIVKSLNGFAIDKVEIDTAARKMRVISHTDAVVKGHYSIDGEVLGFAINEDGDAEINSKNFQVEFVMPYDIVKDASGRGVFDLKGFKYTYDIKDKVEYNFSNLFAGNRALSDTAHKFINRSWSKVLITTYGRPILDVVTSKVFNAFRAYLHTQPIDDILY